MESEYTKYNKGKIEITKITIEFPKDEDISKHKETIIECLEKARYLNH